MGYLFLIIAGWAAYGIFRMMRSGKESQRYLVESREEAPLRVEHLSPPLARLAEDTRLLRISLEAPVRQIRELLVGDLDTTTVEDLDAFDNMLMNVSRQLADWLQTVDRLPADEAATMQDLGLSPEPIRQALMREGWAFERKHLRGPNGSMDQRLGHVIAELRRVETQLQTHRRPYR
ncbi:MAG: hypothetical protein KC501_13860 [Myxococcales bacterium]|nr:hypothetical protein [Myxococcales bacterium]